VLLDGGSVVSLGHFLFGGLGRLDTFLGF
jgi:hypothetical protein